MRYDLKLAHHYKAQVGTLPTESQLHLKDHRQRIPKKIVLRRYLERSIQKKFFSNLYSLQIKTIFQEKTQFAKIYCLGICDLYINDVTHWCQLWRFV